MNLKRFIIFFVLSEFFLIHVNPIVIGPPKNCYPAGEREDCNQEYGMLITIFDLLFQQFYGRKIMHFFLFYIDGVGVTDVKWFRDQAGFKHHDLYP